MYKKIPLNFTTLFCLFTLTSLTAVSFYGCSSKPEVKKQEYAKLSDHRTFEYEFPVVWKGVEEALRGKKVVDRDPEEVDSTEMKKITERSLETDWIYSRSRDKYVEYKINDSPRKIYLQTRVKYNLNVKKVLGGTDVSVKADEEIEQLNQDGTPAGYKDVDDDKKDSSRPYELLEKIKLAILAAPQTSLD